MGIIRRCFQRCNDDNHGSSSVRIFERENKPYDLRDDINEIKYERLRKTPKQQRKEKNQKKIQDKYMRTVIVNNLHPTTTVEDLKMAVIDFGRIYSATISCTFDSNQFRRQGNALLEFGDIQTMVRACNMDGAVLHSRTIRVSPKRFTIGIIKGPATDDGYGPRHGHEHGRSDGAGNALGRSRNIINIERGPRHNDLGTRTQYPRSFLNSQVKSSTPYGMLKRV
ncbi:hypothetical protein BG006_008800 [Podila minutissima]|uniref:RRM domain-containing protein n=1 Tax=Podila minutissima TaxID=64525 RepID=A0A9P5SR33_9FUNG|nr:hypothetical protein BG006_008800 [Podila minutissima]